jgi:capsular polysaccharide biosynthesis protein/Mrp family chromosome partitioning ATPase
LEVLLELGGYIGVVRRWWFVLLASIVVAGVGGYVVASQLPKVYEAEVRLLVGPLNTDFETQRAAGQLANTYAQLATSRRISDAVLQRVGADRPAEELQEAITAVPNDVTRLLIIRVQDTDTQRAAVLANAVAEELGVLAAESARPEGQTQIIDPAGASTIQVAPQVLLIVLLAAFAGLLAAISIVVLIEYSRDAVRSDDELRTLTDVPVLGQLTTRLDRSRDFASAVLASRSADEYLAMTARIEQSLGARKPRSVLVLGVEPGAQTSIVAMGIALAFGDRGVPAAFVDGSSAHGATTEALGIASNPALVAGEWIATGEVPVTSVDLEIDADTAERRRSVPLAVVPGAIGTDVVRTDRLQAILDAALKKAQVAIVTTAPPDRSPEALIWAGLIDAIVLVVPTPGTRRRHIRTAVRALHVARKRFIGTILTDAPLSGRYRFRRPLESRQGTGAPPARTPSPSIRLRPAPRERTPRVEP